jgi:hypothetical protein
MSQPSPAARLADRLDAIPDACRDILADYRHAQGCPAARRRKP